MALLLYKAHSCISSPRDLDPYGIQISMEVCMAAADLTHLCWDEPRMYPETWNPTPSALQVTSHCRNLLVNWRATWMWGVKCQEGMSSPDPNPATGYLCYHLDLHVAFWKRGSGFQRGAQTCEIQWWINLQKCQTLLLFQVTISPRWFLFWGRRSQKWLVN